jgi:hypothetical protein
MGPKHNVPGRPESLEVMRDQQTGVTHLRCAEHGAESQGGPKRELCLLASVAARDALLLLSTSGSFIE